MMNERQRVAPTELVISGSTALLGLLAGIGAAFALWSQLHHTAQPAMLTAAVVALAAGLALVALAVQSRPARLFLLVAGVALAVGFFSGSGAFAALVS